MKFLKTTVIGGLFFLVPVAAIVVLAGKALHLMMAVAEPVARVLPIDSFGGVAIVNILAALAVLLVCFLAGLIGQTKPAKKFASGVENALLSKVPGYSLAKGVADKVRSADPDGIRAALVTLGGSSRIAIEMEQVPGDRLVVYIPSSPNPWTGEVHIVNKDQVQFLDCPITDVIDHVEQLGGGTAALLATANDSGAGNTG